MGKIKSKKCSFTRLSWPKILLKSDNEIKECAKKYLNVFKDLPYIFNLGHGLLPETDPAKLDTLIKFYREYK